MTWLKWIVSVCVLGIYGCATPRIEQLHDKTDDLYAPRSSLSVPHADAPEAKDGTSADFLTQPVDADVAVRIALLKNPHVTAIYSRLGFARADLYDATRLSNPVLGYVGISGSDARKTDWSLSQNFTELLFRRFRMAGAQTQVLLTEQQVARDLLDLEASVRAAYFRYVGSRTIMATRDHVAFSTRVAANYAQQLFDAGNVTKLQLARMQEAADLAQADRVRAHAAEAADRNALMTLLGLESGQAITFIGDYALPRKDPPDAAAMRKWALDNRLDLLSAREALRFASMAETHTRRWRWLGETTIGIASEKDGTYGGFGAQTLVGPSASLSIPLFNQGTGSVDRANATEEALASEVKGLELSIGNDIATRVAVLAAAGESVALYREKLLPTQRSIVDESQRQQNYMLIGAFDLLAAKQHQYEGYEAYVGAVRDYWLAYVDLMRATGGRVPGSTSGSDEQRMSPLAAIETNPGEHP